jgi:hypothetical protein
MDLPYVGFPCMRVRWELKGVDIEVLLIYVCCAFVAPDNKLYKMHGTCIKIIWYIFYKMRCEAGRWMELARDRV